MSPLIPTPEQMQGLCLNLQAASKELMEILPSLPLATRTRLYNGAIREVAVALGRSQAFQEQLADAQAHEQRPNTPRQRLARINAEIKELAASLPPECHAPLVDSYGKLSYVWGLLGASLEWPPASESIHHGPSARPSAPRSGSSSQAPGYEGLKDRPEADSNRPFPASPEATGVLPPPPVVAESRFASGYPAGGFYGGKSPFEEGFLLGERMERLRAACQAVKEAGNGTDESAMDAAVKLCREALRAKPFYHPAPASPKA